MDLCELKSKSSLVPGQPDLYREPLHQREWEREREQEQREREIPSQSSGMPSEERQWRVPAHCRWYLVPSLASSFLYQRKRKTSVLKATEKSLPRVPLPLFNSVVVGQRVIFKSYLGALSLLVCAVYLPPICILKFFLRQPHKRRYPEWVDGG